ncbi:hypothetical protein BO82DRAFT_360702 [Aspergillus uvarum CBS 121591]|uniref:Uncharacterized protein n=1 Tax=Aspergillus uvarum CBS 121591 TaxID=1448315 RepID=A0A319CLH3_9EURO|nr:hypothetical protein BO82DRAFT_360702 [Aspergillus uvarum CBS 121591]PYH86385.1 hypothetical protein BO82DRAFT_360702 [Aspergillus uvarum CBS 121591]
MQELSPDLMLSPEGCESLELLLLPPAMLSLDNVEETLPGPLTLDADPPPAAAWQAPPVITLDPPPPSSPPPIPAPTPATPSPLLLLPPQHTPTQTPAQAPPHPPSNPHPPTAPIDRTTTPSPAPQAQAPRTTPLLPPTVPGITPLPLPLLPENPKGSIVATWIRTLTPYFPRAAGFAIFPTIKVCPRTHVMYDLVIVYAGRTGPYLTTVMGYDRPPEPDAWARRVQVLQDEWRRGVAGEMPVYGAVWVEDEVRWFYGGGS